MTEDTNREQGNMLKVLTLEEARAENPNAVSWVEFLVDEHKQGRRAVLSSEELKEKVLHDREVDAAFVLELGDILENRQIGKKASSGPSVS